MRIQRKNQKTKKEDEKFMKWMMKERPSIYEKMTGKKLKIVPSLYERLTKKKK